MAIFVVIVAATPDGRVAKYAEFGDATDAEAHADTFGGFVAPKPEAPIYQWVADMRNKTLRVGPPPAPAPRKDSPVVKAIRRIADANGVDISDILP